MEHVEISMLERVDDHVLCWKQELEMEHARGLKVELMMKHVDLSHGDDLAGP